MKISGVGEKEKLPFFDKENPAVVQTDRYVTKKMKLGNVDGTGFVDVEVQSSEFLNAHFSTGSTAAKWHAD